MRQKAEQSRQGRSGPLKTAFLSAVALAVLAACQPPEELLPGQRFGVRQTEEANASVAELSAAAAAGVQSAATPQPVDRTPVAIPYVVTGEARPLSLPAQRANAEWTQVGGDATHSIGNPALGAALTRVWSVPIGQGNTRKLRLTATPIVVAGRVITMDTLSDVRAHDTNGTLLWSRNLTPPTETAGQATGGGFAAAGQRLFVTTGWGALHALDLVSGAVLWTQALDANPATAPTIDGNIVYVVSRDGVGWAIDADNGRVLWQLDSTEVGSATVSGSAPAVRGDTAIFAYGSGEVVATLKRGGVRLWSTTVAGQRRGRAYAAIGDLASDPVIVGNRVYTANAAGRLAALDMTTGERLWTAIEGPSSPVWPAGTALFLVSDENRLLRLDAADGTEVWGAALPLYTEERVRSRSGVFAHYGPILAGGRLIVASTDARLRQVDPASGRLLSEIELSGPAAADPVVAGRTLYILTGDGQLHAFR